MCIYCKERCFLFSDIILINSNPNNKHLQNRNFVYINEREVVQNVKITCATSDIYHKCILGMSRIVQFLDYCQWQWICCSWWWDMLKKSKEKPKTWIPASRLVYIGLEGEIQRKICKVVNFHFKPHKLFKC